MHFTSEKRVKLQQLLWIIIYWVVMLRISVFQSIMGVTLIPDEVYHTRFFQILHDNSLVLTLAGITIGLFTGISELFFFHKFLRNKSMPHYILGKTLIYISSMSIIAIFTAIGYYLSEASSNDSIIIKSIELLTTKGFYYIFSVSFMLSLGINFLLIVQNKIGLNNFASIIMGKYHNPREENRIFLFIDLKSSSLMAEQLGHREYSKVLQTCYFDLSELVLKFGGSIYQFVGDEAVITWLIKDKKDFSNSIDLFFTFVDHLKKREHYFQEKFGVFPEFKAALHAGTVMTAEVGGYLKTEIAHHGDVLNTAARMLELAKAFPNMLFISKAIKENLPANFDTYDIISRGKLNLRGKNNAEDIYLIKKEHPNKLLNS